MSCTLCGGRDLAVVAFQAAGKAIYRHCRYCEHSWWESQGRQVPIAQILGAASEIELGRRRGRR